MKLKERIKCKSFWAGLIGSVFLILSAFGVDVGDQTASAIVNAVCSLLVVTGIVTSPVAAVDPGDCERDEIERFDGADEMRADETDGDDA